MLARREALWRRRYGPELLSNGRFTAWTGDNPNGWTLNFTEDGANYVAEDADGMEIVCDNNVAVQITQSGVLTVGQPHLVSVDFVSFTLGGLNLGDNPNGAPAVLPVNITKVTSGFMSGIIIPTTANFSIRRAGAMAAVIRSISCRRVL